MATPSHFSQFGEREFKKRGNDPQMAKWVKFPNIYSNTGENHSKMTENDDFDPNLGLGG